MEGEEPQPQLGAYLKHAYLELPAPANTITLHPMSYSHKNWLNYKGTTQTEPLISKVNVDETMAP